MEINLSTDTQLSGVMNRNSVYQIIKTNILNMNLIPGYPINESAVSQMLGISRTPIREAFVRLNHENLIVSYPQRGTYVTKIDMNLVNESIFMRSCLEKTVYKNAVCHTTQTLIDELNKYLYMQRASIQVKTDFALDFLDYDNSFHRCIFKFEHKENIWNSISDISIHFHRLRYLEIVKRININRVLSQHEVLINAIESHSVDKIESIVDEHMGNVMTIVDELKTDNPEYFL